MMNHSDPARRRRRRRTALVALAVPAVACGLLAGALPAVAADPEPPTQPAFKDGMSQSVFTTDKTKWIREEVWVESETDSDGDGKKDLVHIDVTRVPETAQGLKVPVIMEMSPYYAGGSNVENWSVDHELGDPPSTKPGFAAPAAPRTSPKVSSSWETTWVPRGFAIVHAESVGSGFSEGCPTTGGPNESLGGKAVVDWLNGRTKGYTSANRTGEVSATSWSTGSVGMIGTSYNGTLPIGVASTGVPGLDAIVPVSAISDWYNYYRANGAVRAPGGYQGEDADVLADYVHTRLPQSTCQPVIDDLRAKQDRASGDRTAFWQERNYLANADKIKAATLVAHGQADWNVMTKNASDLYLALKKTGTPHQLYLHRGGHGGNPNDTMLNRWFTRYLFKQANGVENLPKAYIVRENNALTEYADWPVAGSADTTINLKGSKNANEIGALGFGKDATGKTESLVDDATKKAATLAAAPQSENRLVYQTGELSQAVHVSGTSRVSLSLAVDRTKANLTAMLVEYPKTGAPKIITRGWMDMQNRESDRTSKPVNPGAFEQYTLELEPKDTVVPAGSKIGIVVMSSDNEYTIRPAAGTRLTLNPAKSSATLPVVGGAAALAKAMGTAGPGEDAQVIVADVTAGGLAMSVSSADPVVLGGVTLSGKDQTTTGALHAVNVLDSRGTSAGWTLTAQVSDFTSSGGQILSKNLGWKPNAKLAPSDLAADESSVVTPGAEAKPGVGIGDAAAMCTSPKGRSAGAFSCGADLTLGIPGSTRAGTYSAVLTLTLI